jgi:hypothetical protein
VARGLREVATPRAGAAASDLSQQLQAWAEGGCRPLTGEPAAQAAAECERLLRDRAGRQRHPFSAHRLMTLALLAGNNRTAEAVAKVGWGGRNCGCGWGPACGVFSWGTAPAWGRGQWRLPEVAAPLALVQESPAFFPTIEDFLWLKLGLVRPEGRSASVSFGAAAAGGTSALGEGLAASAAGLPSRAVLPPSCCVPVQSPVFQHLVGPVPPACVPPPTPTHPPTHPPGLLDAYHLSDLQRYLQQYPAAHYSHGGREPLLYVVVLLLSLQFGCGAAPILAGPHPPGPRVAAPPSAQNRPCCIPPPTPRLPPSPSAAPP